MKNYVSCKGDKRQAKDTANRWQKGLSGHGPAKTKKGAAGNVGRRG